MSPAAGAGRTSGPIGGWWVVALLLLMLAAGAITVGLRVSRPQPAADNPALLSSSPGVGSGPSSGVGSADTGPSLTAPLASAGEAPSTPVTLRIPAIDLTTPLSTLGLNRDGTVEAPTDFSRAGWFRLGPTPGEVGSAVILGHVDSRRGPAVFFRLRALRQGDRIEVTLASGRVTAFVVSVVRTYPKEQFPASLVYGSHGERALRLVTCGGDFDSRARSYRSNVVAFASLVGGTGPARAPAVE